MNKNTVSGDWNILKGKIKTAWGKLTDDDIDSLKGDMTQLSGKIEKAYGLSKEEATRKFNEFKNGLSSDSSLSADRKDRTSYTSDVDQPRRKPDAH